VIDDHRDLACFRSPEHDVLRVQDRAQSITGLHVKLHAGPEVGHDDAAARIGLEVALKAMGAHDAERQCSRASRDEGRIRPMFGAVEQGLASLEMQHDARRDASRRRCHVHDQLVAIARGSRATAP